MEYSLSEEGYKKLMSTTSEERRKLLLSAAMNARKTNAICDQLHMMSRMNEMIAYHDLENAMLNARSSAEHAKRKLEEAQCIVRGLEWECLMYEDIAQVIEEVIQKENDTPDETKPT